MMVLADTNIWCHFLRDGDACLAELLENGFIMSHPLVVGELSMANYGERKQLLGDLMKMPMASQAGFLETIHLVEERSMHGRGLQWNDVVILSSVLLTGDALLWTRDRRLHLAAEEMGVAYVSS